MRVRNKSRVRHSKILIPCQKCGHKCEISLGYSLAEEDETSGPSSETDVDLKPPAKRTKLTVEVSSSESSDSSESEPDSDSDSDTPNSAVSNPSANSSDSDSSSGSGSADSGSDSDSDSSSSSGSDGAMVPKPLEQSSVRQFFSQFPTFAYNSSRPVMSEYFRMSQTQSFKSLPRHAQRKAREDLKDALAKDFGQLYGTDIDDLGAWQSLCRVLRFENVPDDLEECQELVTATYVNIIDLIDTVSTGDPVRHFDSEKELSSYTLETGNFLSRKSKHAGSLLKFLLRNIFKPTNATRDNPEPLYALGRKRKRHN